MAYKTFKEVQHFNQIWLWIFLIPISLYMIYLAASGLYIQLYLHQPWGDKPVSDNMLLFIAIALLLIGIGFPLSLAYSQLKTNIDESGISFMLKPFHRKYRSLPWNEISQAYVRKYKPILEYGGWGIRFGRSGKAINVSGNMGIQLELTNKKKLLIGTQKPGEAQKVIDYYLIRKENAHTQ